MNVFGLAPGADVGRETVFRHGRAAPCDRSDYARAAETVRTMGDIRTLVVRTETEQDECLGGKAAVMCESEHDWASAPVKIRYSKYQKRLSGVRTVRGSGRFFHRSSCFWPPYQSHDMRLTAPRSAPVASAVSCPPHPLREK